MKYVSEQWYHRLNAILAAVSGGLAVLYFVLGKITSLEPEIIGISAASMAVGAATAVYGAAVYPFVAKRSLRIATGVTFALATLTATIVIQLSGDFSAPLYGLWLFIAFLAGAYGPLVSGFYVAAAALYVTLLLFGDVESSSSVSKIAIFGGLNVVVGVLSYEFWRHYYQANSNKKNKDAKLTSELAREQLQSEILIKSIADGVAAIDNKGKIQLFNPAAQTITGWPEDEVLDMDFSIIFKLFTMGKEQEEPMDINQHPFVTAIKESREAECNDAILHTKNNKSIEIALTVSPIIIDGVVHGAVAIFRDVSEQRKEERQRTEFISTASHEMCTPVAAIEGYLSLAMNEKVAKIDTKARDYLEKAHESTQHLGQLFKDLLAAAKSEDGRLTNHPQVLELDEFLSKVSDDIRFSAEKKGLKLEYAVAGSTGDSRVVSPLYYVHVDPERLREVIANLVSNAIKFTERGGITIGLRGEKDFVQISIKDTGYGIPAEDIPHLFQKFYRVDNTNTRTIGGTGLGLFISRNIIELYNGKIWVESTMGEGSTFYINLPRLSSEQATELKKQEAATATPMVAEQTL